MSLFVFSDVSGGESPSMLVAIRDCIKASNVLSFGKSEDYKPLNFEEAFFLATLGGSQGKLCMRQLNSCQTLKCAVAAEKISLKKSTFLYLSLKPMYPQSPQLLSAA